MTRGLRAGAIVAGCLTLLLVGCSKEASPSSTSSDEPASSSTAAEEPAAAATGGWMDGIPATVPVFEYGTFTKDQASAFESGSGTVYSLYYEDVQKEDVEAYIGDLEAAGFEMTPDNTTSGVSASGSLMEGAEQLIGMSIAWQEGGHVDYTLNVLKQTE